MRARVAYLGRELPRGLAALDDLESLAATASSKFRAGKGRSTMRRELALLEELAQGLSQTNKYYAALVWILIARHQLTPLDKEVERCIAASNVLMDRGKATRAIALLRDEIEMCSHLDEDLSRAAKSRDRTPPAGRLFQYKIDQKRFQRLTHHADTIGRLTCAVGKLDRLYGTLALAFEVVSEFRFAQQASSTAIEYARKAGDRKTEAFARKHSGDLARVGGRHDEARSQYLEALKAYADIGQPAQKVWNGLGLVAWETGNVEEANQWFGKALAAYVTQARDDVAGQATTLVNLGSLQFTCGNVREAKQYFEQAAQLSATSEGRVHTEVIAHINLGNCYETLGAVDNAAREYQRAQQLAAKINNTWLSAYARSLYADVLTTNIVVDVDAEIRLAEDAIRRRMADHWTVPFVLHRRARNCIDHVNLPAAERLLEHALELAGRTGMPDFRLVDLHVDLARARLTRPREALIEIRKARKCWTRYGSQVQALRICIVRFLASRQLMRHGSPVRQTCFSRLVQWMESTVATIGLLEESDLATAVRHCRKILDGRKSRESAADVLLGRGTA
jgi:tetratricopeptide (TPR) repeat protein